ncbi:MAG: peptidyl-prolyl cis-trans isomerase C [Arenicella sp.]|jgi:peptidyl-prolyl cis-trans isomerase C
MKKIILLTTTLLALTACNQQEFNTDQQKFEAYLQTKRVSIEDKGRAERLRAEYERRAALANAIYDSGELETALVDAELEEFRKELLISRYFEQYLNDAVTEQGIQNFYSENVDQYKSRKAKVSHILFRTNARMDEIARQAVLTTATAAYSRLTSGEDFAVVAKETSEDTVSGEKGGELGWINEGAVSDGFSAKVFSMKAGDVSEPFLTDFGFHIVKVVEEPQDVTKPLNALKGDIRYQLRNQSKKAETKRLLDIAGYKAKAAISESNPESK